MSNFTRNIVPVSRLWHRRGKLEFNTAVQLYKNFPGIEFEFHIVLDNFDYQDSWSEKFNELPYKFYWYSKDDMLQYLVDCDYMSKDQYDISKFIHFYHIIINHYLRRKYQYDYTLNIEYDVIFNSKDLLIVENCLHSRLPFSMIEPMNTNCDKSLADRLSRVFDTNVVRYPMYGFNAGLQGINLRIFDEFMNPSTFKILLSIFDFSGIYDSSGNEKIGWERTLIDTQEQSFHCLLNSLSPDFKILPINDYYIFPYWIDMEHLQKSNIIHFIGHQKPDIMFDMIESNLKSYY
jgi:hypothetical protein